MKRMGFVVTPAEPTTKFHGKVHDISDQLITQKGIYI